MARVVQQRKSGPPYLLILFVFLFLVAVVLDVLFYLDSDKNKAAREKAEKFAQALSGSATSGGLDPAVQAGMTQYDRDRKPVLAQKNDQIAQLTEGIAGTPDYAAPLALVEDARKEAARYLPGEGRLGVAVAVQRLAKALDGAGEQLKAKEAEIAALKRDLDARIAELAALGQDREKERAGLNQAIADLRSQLTQTQEGLDRKLADLTEDRDKEIKSRDRQIAERNEGLIKKDEQIALWKKKYEEAVKDVHIGVSTDTPPAPNGKVLRAVGTDAVYVNLGANTSIKPGMTFAVYPSTGVTRDANDWKARILVTSVGPDFSTCRVTNLKDKKVPVLQDDVIYNVVFGRAQSAKFVVVGLFDIYHNGHPSVRGADEVKALIKRFGGTVQDDVAVDTDYVVVGAEPAAPKPSEEGGVAPPELPEDAKARQQYQDVLKKAAEMGVPRLNINRFLQLTGFEASAITGTR
jgi:hypothetical protein